MKEDRLIKTAELGHLTGRSSVTIWRLQKDDPDFPQPISRGRTNYYSFNETMKWIEKEKQTRK